MSFDLSFLIITNLYRVQKVSVDFKEAWIDQ